ncbi:MAG: hypothetical protein SH817_01180 [Leptospira sp.]|nr:hypothetical protein [Leptospira sp.]
MKKADMCDTDCSKEKIREWFLSGKEISSELLVSCDECFQEFTACEESIVSLFPEHTIVTSSPQFAAFYEELDLAKAEKAMSVTHELPDFLKHYTSENLALPERKDALLIRLSQKGIQVINSLLETVKVVESMTPMPILRNAVDAMSPDHTSVIFEETVSNDQIFYYQIVKETSDDIYLSVKAQSSIPNLFHQVNLRKDGRFILSSKIAVDGMASFAGLKAGNYTIEFQGDGQAKSFDLSILVG